MYKVPISILKDNKKLLQDYLSVLRTGFEDNAALRKSVKMVKKQIELLELNYYV